MKKTCKQWLLSAVFAISCSFAAYAQLPYNTTMTQSHYNSGSTVIKKAGSISWENGVKLGTYAPFNWDDKYIVIALNQGSIPYQLSFKYKCNSTIATNPDWYVEESADNSNWSRIWSAVTPTSSSVSVSDATYTATPIDLSKSTKYIKLCYSGNYSGTVSEIKVTDQAYVNDPEVDDVKITSLDFGAASISSGKAEKSFDIEWCNINALSVTCDNTDFFSVTPASFGGKVQYGTQTVTVAYDRNKEVGTHNGTVTVTNGSNTKTVTVSGTTTKRSQVVHWNTDLAATNFALNAGDNLTGAEIATADNEEAELTYTTSDANVVAVSEDGKTLYAGENGTALITVTATGNDIYDEVVDSIEFTVTSKSKQTISWDQDLLGLKTTQANATIALEATATSGGVITYAIEGGSADCITLSGENNATLTITGAAGEAYIIATQEGGLIGEEEWISATYRKHVKVRDPNAACDEYALADKSFTFAQGHKSTFAVQEYKLDGKPTTLSFTAKAGSTQYLWSEREPIYIDQYANFGSGLEWKQITAVTLEENSKNYGPYALNETATKIRFRTGDYSKQEVSNISVPRKKELVVSETNIVEEAERNVRWTKTISVSRSNIDVMDLSVVSSDPACPFELSKTSVGADCADHNTETFTVSITPRVRDSVYTGMITITDGKATPTTHTIGLSIKAIAFQQTINGFELPETALTTEEFPAFTATATSGLEVVYLSSDSTIAYVENNKLVVLSAGTADITAYQAGDDRYASASQTKTIVLSKTSVEIYTAPSASWIVAGETLAESLLTGGEASTRGSFAWLDPTAVPEAGEQTYTVRFTPANEALYETASAEITVLVSAENKHDQTITWSDELPQFYMRDTLALTASATSHLEVYFTSSDSAVAYVDADNRLITLAVGEALITAHQSGNNFYNPSEPVAKTVTVIPFPATYGEYTALVCEGDSVEYAGVWYREAVVTEVTLAGENYLGGDSVVTLTVSLHQPYAFEETKMIYVAAEETWQNINLATLPVGDTTLLAEYHTAYGCDSVYTLHLSVLARPTTYGNDTLYVCAGEKIEYAGKTYKRPAHDSVLLAGENYLGGDSIVALVVYVRPVMRIVSRDTIIAGTEKVWQGYDLSTIGVGDTTLVAEYTSIYGCDSTFMLHLTVKPLIITYGAETIRACSGETVTYEGNTYSRSVTDTIVLSGRNYAGCDSIVTLVVSFSQPFLAESDLTIAEGDEETWQNIDLSAMGVGDTTLVAEYTSIYGCDSTYTLHLTVNPRIITYGSDTIYACSGETVTYEGNTYSRSAADTILLSGQNYAGGDSIVVLAVIFSQPFYSEADRTIVEGGNEVWQEIDLSILPVGDTTLVAEYQTLHGCDSIYTLYLTVEPNTEAIPFTNAEELNVRKVLINDAVYIRKGDELFDIRGQKVVLKE